MVKLNIIIAGVGGQGVELASDILETLALEAGLDVKKMDTQGIAQHDGSIVTQLRIGEEVASTLIGEDEADILLAFEKVEAARCSEYLRNGGIAIVNDMSISRPSVGPGSEAYPNDGEIMQILYRRAAEVMVVNGSRRAVEIGNTEVLNVFMLGTLSMLTPFNPEMWEKVILRRLPPKILDISLEAFELGRRKMMGILDGMPGECDCSTHADDEDCGCH
jgi:indolepyruvate ferredoxin oxidoreductase beta subunit